jgi:hypothetical protein
MTAAVRTNRCTRCTTQLVEIELSLGGNEVTMRSCSRCDRRSWVLGGHEVGLDGVLTATASASAARH